MKLKTEIALVKLNVPVADKQPELQTHNYDLYSSTAWLSQYQIHDRNHSLVVITIICLQSFVFTMDLVHM